MTGYSVGGEIILSQYLSKGGRGKVLRISHNLALDH